ncbi:MAG: TolC family protein [Flavobacteriales bacterium]|nr:TolC family protein [Flavobacteriales bacterium]MBP9080952.1 TolC family protein [Flavobacteriales bacterium]
MRTVILLPFMLMTPLLWGQQPWTLEQCLAKARERNLDVRNAALDADLADKAHEQAYWSFLPNLNGAATHGYNWGKTIDQYTNTFATDRVRTNNLYLNSDVALFQGGRKHQELKQAALNEQAAGKVLEAMHNEISTAVVRAYLDLLGLQEQVAAADAQAQATEEQAVRTQTMVEAGRSPRADLLDIQAQQAQEEFNAETLRIQAEKARLTLAQLMLLDEGEAAALRIASPAIGALAITEPAATESEILARVVASNPAFAAADLNMQGAARGVAISRTNAIPSLSFNASLGTGYSGRNLEAVGNPQPDGSILIGTTEEGIPVYAPNFTQATRVKSLSQQLDDNLNESIGFTLSIPIFNNMGNRLATDRARVQYEQAKNELAKRRNTLQVDVQNAMTAQRGAYRQYISAKLSVDAAEESLRMADERYAQQAITATELNVAKARLQQSTAQLINAKYSYLMAEKALDILQGLPLSL